MSRDNEPKEEQDGASDEQTDSAELEHAESTSGEPLVDADDVGAYLLDALTEEERAEFEDQLADSPEIQAELTLLAPVVALLPKMLELDGAITGELAAPSETLRSRILAAAELDSEDAPPTPRVTTTVLEPLASDSQVKEVVELDASGPQSGETPEEVIDPEESEPPQPLVAQSDTQPFTTPKRPQGRIRSGVQTVPGQPVPTPIETLGRAPRSWVVAASMAAVAVGAIIWSLALLGRIDDQESEINAQSTALATVREQANATAFQLLATEDGSADASGTLYYSLPSQRGVLEVRNMAQLPEGQVYQVWYIESGNPTPIPGATLTVDDNGYGVVAVAPNAPTFNTVALTTEPQGGSQAPTSPVVLAGSLPGAAG